MSKLDIDNVKLTKYHLIVEEVFDESVFGMVAPSTKIKGIKVIGTSHLQVMRRVYTIVIGQDIYFKGRKLQGSPGARELFSEFVEPGTQLTSKSNGHVSLLHSYLGKKNIFTAKAMEHYKKSVTLNFLRLFGEDPCPTRTLYGNPAATFIQKTGEQPIAAAYYNGYTARLELLHYFDRRTLADNFMKRFSEASATAVG